jgi:hypothetical protein
MKHRVDLHVNLKNVHDVVCNFSLISSSLPFSIGDLNEQGKDVYNLLINRCTSNSSSSSSNPEKSDSHSHYSSISTDNDDNHSISSLNSRSSSINKNEQHSITGQPLPPPPDLTSLGSKLTTATMAHTFKLPASLTTNKYRIKSMKND